MLRHCLYSASSRSSVINVVPNCPVVSSNMKSALYKGELFNYVKCTQLFEKDNTSIFITLWKREIFKIMSVEICFVLTVSKYFIRVSSNSEADASELLETMMKGERFIH